MKHTVGLGLQPTAKEAACFDTGYAVPQTPLLLIIDWGRLGTSNGCDLLLWTSRAC